MKSMLSLAMVALAGTAGASLIYSGEALRAAELDSPMPELLVTSGVPYSNMGLGSNFSVRTPAAADADGQLETLASDDYDSIADDDILLGEFRFVGGVDIAGGVMFFEFYDTAGDLVSDFGVQFAEAGNFIWTITLGTPIVVPDAGTLVVLGDDDGITGTGSRATWFLNSLAPTIGTTTNFPGFTDSLGTPLNFKFELIATPAPGAAALAMAGGLAAARRRR